MKKTFHKFSYVLPVLVIFILFLIWYCISYFHFVPTYQLPSPYDVAKSFKEEIVAGRLIKDRPR